MLSDKIFTEEEEYRLRYSENPDFLRLKTWGTEPIQILVLSTLHLVTASLVLGLVREPLTLMVTWSLRGCNTKSIHSFDFNPILGLYTCLDGKRDIKRHFYPI